MSLWPQSPALHILNQQKIIVFKFNIWAHILITSVEYSLFLQASQTYSPSLFCFIYFVLIYRPFCAHEHLFSICLQIISTSSTLQLMIWVSSGLEVTWLPLLCVQILEEIVLYQNGIDFHFLNPKLVKFVFHGWGGIPNFFTWVCHYQFCLFIWNSRWPFLAFWILSKNKSIVSGLSCYQEATKKFAVNIFLQRL